MSEAIDINSQPANESRALTPFEMLGRAVETGASVETLEKLMTLHERWEKNEARKAFVSSMAKARETFRPILKTNDGYANRYKYESLIDVTNAVDPALSENGFSYDWVTEDLEGDRVRVTCVITHDQGHEKRNSLSGDPRNTADEKANMNEFQRLGGAVTYLQRITLKAALGVAAGSDNDAGGALTPSGKSPIEWAQPWLNRIEKEKSNNWSAEIKADFAKATDGEDWPQQAIALVQGAFAARLKREKDLHNA